MVDMPGSVLVAEIGSLITRVTLIDQVDGESRLVGHAETSSSIEPPYQNALYAILEATAQIAELSGRQLLRDGQLLMPQSNERDGINQVVVVTSAAGAMALVITAIAADVSARSAIHASRASYTALLQVVTLDDAVVQPGMGSSDLSWIERQVEGLLGLQPDAVLITGGLEHGAVDTVNRLAHIVGLTAVSVEVDSSGQQRQDITARPVIYAGNSDARERVIEALSDRAEIFVVDNVRPALDKEQLAPTRQEISRLYEKQILPRLPGIAGLRRMSRAPIRTVCDATGLITRFIAERSGRHLLLVDVGASSSSAFYAAPKMFSPAVLGTLGISYGLSALIEARGVAAVARWLPFPITEQELTHRLLNKLLRPHLLPASRDDAYIDLALTREALSMTVAALRDETPANDYDWLVASGGALAHAVHPGEALLALLDGLQPSATQQQPLIDVHLDTLGLVPACGALAGLSPDAAVTVFDRDLRNNLPLATVVVPIGDGKTGDVALEVELSTVGGRTIRQTVRHGELVRLPLSQGRYGQLTLRPSAGVRIGQAAPGEEVASDAGAISGSALGVVIDTRGRPLRLPEDDQERCLLLWQWLVALGAEHGPSPYVEERAGVIASPAAAPEIIEKPAVVPAEPPPAPVVAPVPAVVPEVAVAPSEVAATSSGAGRRISLSDLAAQEGMAPAAPPAPAEPPSKLDNDLDSLRQTVEQPKKRGLFGRKN